MTFPNFGSLTLTKLIIQPKMFEILRFENAEKSGESLRHKYLKFRNKRVTITGELVFEKCQGQVSKKYFIRHV